MKSSKRIIQYSHIQLVSIPKNAKSSNLFYFKQHTYLSRSNGLRYVVGLLPISCFHCQWPSFSKMSQAKSFLWQSSVSIENSPLYRELKKQFFVKTGQVNGKEYINMCNDNDLGNSPECCWYLDCPSFFLELPTHNAGSFHSCPSSCVVSHLVYMSTIELFFS